MTYTSEQLCVPVIWKVPNFVANLRATLELKQIDNQGAKLHRHWQSFGTPYWIYPYKPESECW